MLLFIVNSVFKVNYYKDFVTTEWMMAQGIMGSLHDFFPCIHKNTIFVLSNAAVHLN
ncbi:Uncharacterised protein [Porphyromonas macacae]|uniref:Uncharacterized protein n=1 Tax=Porphyromonas macacae TaxID=28115 RepID=A0A379DII5_9PORP|nr:Uncharacterised protein [Porphyromonas macacae]